MEEVMQMKAAEHQWLHVCPPRAGGAEADSCNEAHLDFIRWSLQLK